MGSFDRKVERNMVKLKKKGKNPVIKGSVAGSRTSPAMIGPKGEGEIFKGRKIILPVVLTLLALMYGAVGLIGSAIQENAILFWVTVGLYILLAVVIFLRKPYLRIDKNRLYSSKFNRDISIDAGNISKIVLGQGKIVIVPKVKAPKWVFYRFRNRFDTDAMAIQLEQFGLTHNVKIDKQ
jgi:hypothetical protein